MSAQVKGRLLQEPQALDQVLRQSQVIATIGARDSGPAYEIPSYLAEHGYTVIPISLKLEQAFGQRAYARVDEVPQPVDVVQIFRRSEVVPSHVEEILAMSPLPKVVWMQLGISHEEAASQLMAHGIDVVMDHCMRQEHKRMLASGAAR